MSSINSVPEDPLMDPSIPDDPSVGPSIPESVDSPVDPSALDSPDPSVVDSVNSVPVNAGNPSNVSVASSSNRRIEKMVNHVVYDAEPVMPPEAADDFDIMDLIGEEIDVEGFYYVPEYTAVFDDNDVINDLRDHFVSLGQKSASAIEKDILDIVHLANSVSTHSGSKNKLSDITDYYRPTGFPVQLERFIDPTRMEVAAKQAAALKYPFRTTDPLFVVPVVNDMKKLYVRGKVQMEGDERNKIIDYERQSTEEDKYNPPWNKNKVYINYKNMIQQNYINRLPYIPPANLRKDSVTPNLIVDMPYALAEYSDIELARVCEGAEGSFELRRMNTGIKMKRNITKDDYRQTVIGSEDHIVVKPELLEVPAFFVGLRKEWKEKIEEDERGAFKMNEKMRKKSVFDFAAAPIQSFVSYRQSDDSNNDLYASVAGKDSYLSVHTAKKVKESEIPRRARRVEFHLPATVKKSVPSSFGFNVTGKKSPEEIRQSFRESCGLDGEEPIAEFFLRSLGVNFPGASYSKLTSYVSSIVGPIYDVRTSQRVNMYLNAYMADALRRVQFLNAEQNKLNEFYEGLVSRNISKHSSENQYINYSKEYTNFFEKELSTSFDAYSVHNAKSIAGVSSDFFDVITMGTAIRRSYRAGEIYNTLSSILHHSIIYDYQKGRNRSKDFDTKDLRQKLEDYNTGMQKRVQVLEKAYPGPGSSQTDELIPVYGVDSMNKKEFRLMDYKNYKTINDIQVDVTIIDNDIKYAQSILNHEKYIREMDQKMENLTKEYKQHVMTATHTKSQIQMYKLRWGDGRTISKSELDIVLDEEEELAAPPKRRSLRSEKEGVDAEDVDEEMEAMTASEAASIAAGEIFELEFEKRPPPSIHEVEDVLRLLKSCSQKTFMMDGEKKTFLVLPHPYDQSKPYACLHTLYEYDENFEELRKIVDRDYCSICGAKSTVNMLDEENAVEGFHDREHLASVARVLSGKNVIEVAGTDNDIASEYENVINISAYCKEHFSASDLEKIVCHHTQYIVNSIRVDFVADILNSIITDCLVVAQTIPEIESYDKWQVINAAKIAKLPAAKNTDAFKRQIFYKNQNLVVYSIVCASILKFFSKRPNLQYKYQPYSFKDVAQFRTFDSRTANSDGIQYFAKVLLSLNDPENASSKLIYPSGTSDAEKLSAVAKQIHAMYQSIPSQTIVGDQSTILETTKYEVLNMDVLSLEYRKKHDELTNAMPKTIQPLEKAMRMADQELKESIASVNEWTEKNYRTPNEAFPIPAEEGQMITVISERVIKAMNELNNLFYKENSNCYTKFKHGLIVPKPITIDEDDHDKIRKDILKAEIIQLLGKDTGMNIDREIVFDIVTNLFYHNDGSLRIFDVNGIDQSTMTSRTEILREILTMNRGEIVQNAKRIRENKMKIVEPVPTPPFVSESPPVDPGKVYNEIERFLKNIQSGKKVGEFEAIHDIFQERENPENNDIFVRHLQSTRKFYRSLMTAISKKLRNVDKDYSSNIARHLERPEYVSSLDWTVAFQGGQVFRDILSNILRFFREENDRIFNTNIAPPQYDPKSRNFAIGNARIVCADAISYFIGFMESQFELFDETADREVIYSFMDEIMNQWNQSMKKDSMDAGEFSKLYHVAEGKRYMENQSKIQEASKVPGFNEIQRAIIQNRNINRFDAMEVISDLPANVDAIVDDEQYDEQLARRVAVERNNDKYNLGGQEGDFGYMNPNSYEGEVEDEIEDPEQIMRELFGEDSQ